MLIHTKAEEANKKSGLACLLSFPSTIQSSCDAGESRETSLGLGKRIYSYSFQRGAPIT